MIVLRATHAIAQFDGVTETPSLQTLLRDYLEAQPDRAETPEPAETPEIPADPQLPASETHLRRRPWWLATVAAHQERGTLPELTHDLFWLMMADYMNSTPKLVVSTTLEKVEWP